MAEVHKKQLYNTMSVLENRNESAEKLCGYNK